MAGDAGVERGVSGVIPAADASASCAPFTSARWSLAAQLAIVAPWLSWDFIIHRLPLGPYLFGISVTVLVAAVYLTSFAARERRILRDLEYLNQAFE